MATIALKVEELSGLERWRRGLKALSRTVRDPDDTASVLEFGAYVNAGGAGARVARFLADPDGARLYAERRALDSRTVDLDALARLPDGTLGREYARFMQSRGLSPDIFQAPANVASPEFAYLAQRMRQTHDLWHVLTGYETDIPGEIVLQAFTYAQSGAPSSLLIALFGSLRLLPHRPLGWWRALSAYRRGRATRSLATFPWEEHWTTPVSELRRLLGCP